MKKESEQQFALGDGNRQSYTTHRLDVSGIINSPPITITDLTSIHNDLLQRLSDLPELNKITEGYYDFAHTRLIQSLPVLPKVLAFITPFLPPLTGIGWMAWMSTKYYLDYGKQGAELIPGFNFMRQLAGESCFGVNAVLNFYCIIMVLLELRQVLLTLHLKSTHGKQPSAAALLELTAKILASLVYAVIAALPSYYLALKDNKPLVEQIIVLIVNTLMNTIGSYAFIDLLKWFCFTLPKNLIVRCCGTAQENKAKEVLATITEELKQQLELLKNLPDDSYVFQQQDPWVALTADDTELHRLPSEQPSNQASWFGKLLGGINHFSLQACNVISVWGLFRNTIDGTGNPKAHFHVGTPVTQAPVGSALQPFKITNSPAQIGLGTTLFTPSMGMYMKFVFETAADINQAAAQVFSATKHPNAYGWKTHALTALNMALLAGNYFFAWNSSSGSLDVNRCYGLVALWAIYMTCLSTAAVNGYGGKELIKKGVQLLKEQWLYSANKRTVLQRSQQIIEYIGSLEPEALEPRFMQYS